MFSKTKYYQVYCKHKRAEPFQTKRPLISLCSVKHTIIVFQLHLCKKPTFQALYTSQVKDILQSIFSSIYLKFKLTLLVDSADIPRIKLFKNVPVRSLSFLGRISFIQDIKYLPVFSQFLLIPLSQNVLETYADCMNSFCLNCI